MILPVSSKAPSRIPRFCRPPRQPSFLPIRLPPPPPYSATPFPPTLSRAFSSATPFRQQQRGPQNLGNIFGQPAPAKGETLKAHSVDVSALAREGVLDPVIGRDEEILLTRPTRQVNIPSRMIRPWLCLELRHGHKSACVNLCIL
ncbi:hypothetical protein BT69DRAFT_38521 [Atractiella rhizophila]|nr:hypothetical protein BT69DRAFT_38521 [Atractiella rhizophila]